MELFIFITMDDPQSWTNDCRQFTKVNKIAFCTECFTANFSQFYSTNVKICPWGDGLGTRYKI